MNRIAQIHIYNFKFFGEEKPLILDGKHLLLFGENGSGKSTIYWSLYTLFEAPFKDEDAELIKYFQMGAGHDWSLVNIHAKEVAPAGSGIYDSSIEVKTIPDVDGNVATFTLSLTELAIRKRVDAKLVNYASDFIQYRLLQSMHNFVHQEANNLYRFFVDQTLQHVQFDEIEVKRGDKVLKLTNAYDIWLYAEEGFEKKSEDALGFEKLISHFNDGMNKLIAFVNSNAQKFLSNLGYANFKFYLKYDKADYDLTDHGEVSVQPFLVELVISEYEGVKNSVHRAHSFLNEAKLNAIAISVRLAVLFQKLDHAGLKFIVLDDLLVSLDMNNRDKLLDLLFNPKNKFLEKFQLLFLTHDKSLYHFVEAKIRQWDNSTNWVFKEMYVGKDEKTNWEFPVVIDSIIDNVTRAKKYMQAGDYTSSSLYVRKELEKITSERLTDEDKIGADGYFKSLAMLWGLMTARYAQLGTEITDEIKNSFEQTKLMVLNPQAHHNLSEPVYKNELEKALELLKNLSAYPIPVSIILLSRGMKLQFKHPNHPYTIDFELLSPYQIDELNGIPTPVLPKCKVITWQYDTQEFWDVDSGRKFAQGTIDAVLERKEDRLSKCIENLKRSAALAITEDMFFDNTKLTNGIWTLKEVMTEGFMKITKARA